MGWRGQIKTLEESKIGGASPVSWFTYLMGLWHKNFENHCPSTLDPNMGCSGSLKNTFISTLHRIARW